jgi:hypothetical protein
MSETERMLIDEIDKRKAAEERADRYQAEFAACKALLIAAQTRAERAEAERATAEAPMVQWSATLAVAQRNAADAIRALAALPVEPARPRQENDQKAGTVVPTPLRPCHTEGVLDGVRRICNRPTGHPPPHMMDLYKRDEAVDCHGLVWPESVR